MPSDDTLRNVPSSPHQRAATCFRAYLAERPSVKAQAALREAFMLWSGAEGSSKTIAQAVKHIPVDADVWTALVPLMMQAFVRDGRQQEGFVLAQEFADRVQPLASRSAFQSVVGKYYLERGALAEAEHAFADVFRWNASKPLVEQAITHLFTLTGADVRLPVGAAAPRFAAIDFEGEVLDFAAYDGCITLLHFWDPALAINGAFHEQLRRIAQDYLVHGVNLIGIAPSIPAPVMQAALDANAFFWPQVCEHDRSLPFQYGVEIRPTTMLIDREGILVGKYIGTSGGALLRAAVHRLILGR